MGILIVAYILIFILLIGAGVLIAGHSLRAHIRRHYYPAILHVAMPKNVAKEVNEESAIEKTQALLASFQKMQMPLTLELVVPAAGEEMHYYVLVSRTDQKKALQAIKEIYSQAKIEETQAHSFWLDNAAKVFTGALTQTKPYAMPLNYAAGKTMADTLRTQLSRLATIGEGVVIQWLIQPAGEQYKNEVADLLQRIAQEGNVPKQNMLHKDFVLSRETIPVLKEKIAFPLLAVEARVLLVAGSEMQLTHLREKIEQAINRTAMGQNYNALTLTPNKQPAPFLAALWSRNRLSKQPAIVNIRELASLFHIPVR